jgi:hypothetical protein
VASVTGRCLRSRLLGCAFSPIALFVLTTALCFLTLLVTMVLCVLTSLLRLLTVALTPPFVVVVAVRVYGSPPLADEGTDVFQLVPYTHLCGVLMCSSSDELRGHDITLAVRTSVRRDVHAEAVRREILERAGRTPTGSESHVNRDQPRSRGAYPGATLSAIICRFAGTFESGGPWLRRLILAFVIALGGRRAYRLLASGAVTIDVGIGRRVRNLGPRSWHIAAGREIVFDVIAGPYLGRTPRTLEDKLEVWERGSDMVLAAHFTAVKCGVTTTLETVRFERPERIDFRLVRGPVPHVVESFVLEVAEGGTRLTWEGELATDFWALGARWGNWVARSWDKAVRSSLEAVVAEAERRAGREG